MRRRLPLILGYLSVAAFVVTLAAWPLSYAYSGVLAIRGYGVMVDHGAYYFAGPDGFGGRSEASASRIDLDYTLEEMLRLQTNRWTPIRVIDSSVVGRVFILAAWVPPLVFTYPAWLTVRRWRRGRREAGRGFEVAGVV